MEEVGKLPLKRVEISLTKFNEVAIPHHLDLLRQHKANIIKYGQCGDSVRVSAEQTHARRVAGQLRVLLAELDALRRQVRPDDWARFDALTQRTRDNTLRVIVDYLESSPVTIQRQPSSEEGVGEQMEEEDTVSGSVRSSDSVGVLALDSELLQLQHDEQERRLRERERALRGWAALQRELSELHDVWRHVHAAAARQRAQVDVASGNIEVAAENVAVARSNLSIAERLGAGAVSAGAALLGAACGGPLGLLAGAKAGAAAALAGAALAVAAARALRPAPPRPRTPALPHDKQL